MTARAIASPGATPPAAPDVTVVEPIPMGLPRLCLLALVVGVVTGLGAVVFRALIGFIHNLFFLGKFAVLYDANQFTPPGPWGPWVILVPVIGGLVVTFLVTNFAPEARGHGVPEVIDAIFYKGGVIRPIVAVVKSLVRLMREPVTVTSSSGCDASLPLAAGVSCARTGGDKVSIVVRTHSAAADPLCFIENEWWRGAALRCSRKTPTIACSKPNIL